MACALSSPKSIKIAAERSFPETTGVGMSALDGETAASKVFGRGFDARVHGISLSGWQQHPWSDWIFIRVTLWGSMDGPWQQQGWSSQGMPAKPAKATGEAVTITAIMIEMKRTICIVC